MEMCIKITKWMAILFIKIAMILVLLGVIGFLMWTINGSILFNVANFWNYLMASIPFSLLAIGCILFVVASKNKA
jgi:uncharacterized membrane protein